MLAVYADSFGGDDPIGNAQVGEIDDPVPGEGEALVRVSAAALNHHDLWTLRGVASGRLTGRQVLGCDAAGVVEAYGPGRPEGVPDPGSRVVVHAVVGCGRCRACRSGDTLACSRIAILSDPGQAGTLAESLVVPAANLLPLPDTVSDAAAACLPTAYLTAYHMLFARARLEPGQTVLIQGASGGVPRAALQLSLAAGVRVLVTSRSEEQRRRAVADGAAAAFAPDVSAREILTASDGGVDAVIETVGEATWDLSLRSLRAGGTVVVAGTTTGANPPSQLNRVFWKHLTIAGSSMGRRDELERLVQMCAASHLDPTVDSVHPLTEAPAALRRLDEGRRLGKIVLKPGPVVPASA